VDAFVARADQLAVSERFEYRTLMVFTVHPEEERIEVQLGEIDGGRWRYRRNPAVAPPIDRLMVNAPGRVPVLALMSCSCRSSLGISATGFGMLSMVRTPAIRGSPGS
jgi:hypothetical protein